jgi:ABC-type molybdenum transport system ATPase subunit/photorepair protein PhrA
MTTSQFEQMSLKQKAFYPFTDSDWNSLSKDQKKRIFFARNKFKTQGK